jgi:hypothetical protein
MPLFLTVSLSLALASLAARSGCALGAELVGEVIGLAAPKRT